MNAAPASLNFRHFAPAGWTISTFCASRLDFSAVRASCPDSWQAYVTHDFVTGLGDGSLPKAGFINYLIQDYIFLVHFSRAWALAVVKSDSLLEMKTAAATVDGLVNHEMQLHIKICAEEGISEEQLFGAEEMQANLAYTRFVMDAGFSGDFLDGVIKQAEDI